MPAFAWPDDLKPTAFGYHHIDADMSGGAAMGGGEQFVFSPGPRWGASVTLQIRNSTEVLAIRALRAQLRGRANFVNLPNFDGKRLSWPINDHGIVLTPRVTRNTSLDGTAYEDPEIPDDSEIEAELFADADARAVSVRIRVLQGGQIKAGQQFGIAARLYEIAEITDISGLTSTCSIWPPLRQAWDALTVVKFTRPVCAMRCMNLNEELTKLEMLRFATLNLQFQEYLPPGGGD